MLASYADVLRLAKERLHAWEARYMPHAQENLILSFPQEWKFLQQQRWRQKGEILHSLVNLGERPDILKRAKLKKRPTQITTDFKFV